MQQQYRRTGWLAGATLTSMLGLVAVGAASVTTSGCDNVERVVTCAALNNFRPSLNASATGEASNIAVAITRPVMGSPSIPAGIPLAGISIEENDIGFSGTGTGTIRLVFAVDSVVVAFTTVNVTNGQITSAPGKLRLGVFDNAAVSAMLTAVPVQARTGLRLPVSGAEARTRTAVAIRSNSFDMTIGVQFTGNLNGTAKLESIGFFCD